MDTKSSSGQAEFRLPCSRLFNQEPPSVSCCLTLETPQCHLYVEANGPDKQPTNAMRLMTGCPPHQAGPDSCLPAAAYAELLSPKQSTLRGVFSWGLPVIKLVWLPLGRRDSTYVFLRSGKKLGGGRAGGIKSERKPAAIQNSLRFIRSTAYSKAAII